MWRFSGSVGSTSTISTLDVILRSTMILEAFTGNGALICGVFSLATISLLIRNSRSAVVAASNLDGQFSQAMCVREMRCSKK